MPDSPAPTRADRWRGAMLGVALGDAVGAPFEGARHVDAAEVERWLSSSRLLRWTDDTAMTLGLARSLVECDGKVDLQHLGDTFAADHRAEPWRGYGAGPPQVFAAAARGAPYIEAAATMFDGAGSWGNGAAMRAVPCAIVGGDDLDRVADLARTQSLVTHAHPLAQDGAALLAMAVAAIATSDHDDAQERIADVIPLLATTEMQTAATLAVELGPTSDVPAIVRELGHGQAAVEAVPAALAAFLGAPGAPREMLIHAVALGGDTDTIAAMAGALVGARVGSAGLPRDLLERLEARKELAQLAVSLAEVTGEA